MSDGSVVTTDDLVVRTVGFDQTSDADRYVAAADGLPASTTLGRDVGAGELLPRAALSADQPTFVEVPLSVGLDAVPAAVRDGSIVDVWVTPASRTGKVAGAAQLVFERVVVVDAPRSGGGLGPGSTRQIIIGLPEDRQATLAEAIASTASGVVVVTKQQ